MVKRKRSKKVNYSRKHLYIMASTIMAMFIIAVVVVSCDRGDGAIAGEAVATCKSSTDCPKGYDCLRGVCTSTEICTDEMDNDFDKLIDCNDPDCAQDTACVVTGPTSLECPQLVTLKPNEQTQFDLVASGWDNDFYEYNSWGVSIHFDRANIVNNDRITCYYEEYGRHAQLVKYYVDLGVESCTLDSSKTGFICE